ncbi:DUF2993 domain-containing protein [Trichocoleus desertorum AS-A10]|uniref:LmeA family phospholipid-binding protein n=1 Tax=Trichocoleus desertorum TaxID=1481672 RepID=UPI003296A55E
MEFLTIFLSSLIALVSPAGLVLDRVAENAVRSQFESVEQLQVRVDNAPSYQIVQGKAEKVRIAGRGLFPLPEFRIAALDVETDPIDINPRGGGKGLKLDRPLQAGVHLVLTQADINRALSSPTVTKRLRDLGASALEDSEAQQVQRYDFLNPQVELLPNNRIRAKVELQEQGQSDRLQITVESGLAVVAGKRLQLVEPRISVNGEAVPQEILDPIARGVTERFDLDQLAGPAVTARVLQLKVVPEQQIDIVAFVRAETPPASPAAPSN